MLAVAIVAGAVIVGCGSGGSSGTTSGGGEQTSFTVELDWIPGPNHPVLYWGKDQGFFEEEGLSVDLIPPSDPSAPLKLVATEKVDLALSYEPEVMVSAEQGLGVKVVGSVFPVPLASFIASGESDIKEVADLKGKSVGYSGIPVFGAYTETMLEHAGLSKEEVEVVNVGFNEVPALLSGKVSALTDAYRNDQAVQIWVEQGVKPTVIPVDELGVPTYDELVFIANSHRLESDPEYKENVENFLSAYYTSFEDAKKHPKEVAEVLAKESKRGVEEMEKAVPISLELMEPASGNPGCLSEAKWTKFGEWMVEKELLKSPPNLSELMTNELLGESCE